MKINNLIYQYLELLKKQGRLSIKTINAYSTDLKQFVKLTDNSDLLNKTTILDYISYLNDNYKERTVKRKIASVKAFFSFLLYEEFIDFNPFSKIKIKFKKVSILPRTISIKDLNTLFQYLYNKKKSSKIKSYEYSYTIRNIAILELLLGTGIRVAELCNLKKHDVMISETKIRVLGKGKKERILPIIHTSILKALTEYEEYFFNKEENFDFYFINKYKQKLSEQSIRNIISKVSKACQIQTHITPHMFRHTFATLLLDNNVDILYIQKLLGHSSIQTTQIYTHVNSKKFFEIMKDKNPRLNLTFDLDNNELSKEAVKVYHRKVDVLKFINAKFNDLSTLVN